MMKKAFSVIFCFVAMSFFGAHQANALGVSGALLLFDNTNEQGQWALLAGAAADVSAAGALTSGLGWQAPVVTYAVSAMAMNYQALFEDFLGKKVQDYYSDKRIDPYLAMVVERMMRADRELSQEQAIDMVNAYLVEKGEAQ